VKDPILGVTDIVAQNFVMTPNPATDIVTISSKSNPISHIAVYNMLGQKAIEKNFINSISEDLDISNLNSGVYLISINNTTPKRLLVK
jgi:hypothetical protein